MLMVIHQIALKPLLPAKDTPEIILIIPIFIILFATPSSSNYFYGFLLHKNSFRSDL